LNQRQDSFREDLRSLAPILGIMALAVCVRVWHLTTFDMWTDEVHTLSIARTGQYSFGPTYRLAPLNFIATRFAIGALGLNELAGRIVPFIAGVLTVLATYFVGKRWLGRRAALFASLLLAISPWHVYWSQNARHIAPVSLFVLLGLHGFLLYWKANVRAGLILAPVCLAIALAVHPSAAFYPVALLAFVSVSWLVWLLRTRPHGWAMVERRHAAAFGAVALVLVAYVPVSLSIGSYLTANIAPWNPLSNLIGSLVFYIPPYLALTALGGAVFLWREQDDMGLLLATLVVIPVVQLALASRFTIASAPYVFASLVPVVLLAGAALDRLLILGKAARMTPAMALVVAGVAVSQLFELTLYHTKYRGFKARWREAAEFVRANRDPNDVVVATDADAVNFYLGSTDVRWYGTKELDPAVFPPRTASGVWYLVFTADEPLVASSLAARQRVLGSKELKQLLPLSFGPKDRSLGVFYEKVKPPNPRAVADGNTR